MNTDEWYSVRMRASQFNDESDEKHVSGGELLCRYEQLEKSITFLANKALQHSRGQADFMQIQLEKIKASILTLPPLQPTTHTVEQVIEGQNIAKKRLIQLGVQDKAIESALELLFTLGNMRGAMIVDCVTGQRLDNSGVKGIRVTRLSWEIEDFQNWCHMHKVPNNIRTKEALTLASKVAYHPATVAELCWSDDPEYITGYVASKKSYERITHLKNRGDEQGCRIFFVKPDVDLQAYTTYLTKQPVLIQTSKGDNYYDI